MNPETKEEYVKILSISDKDIIRPLGSALYRCRCLVSVLCPTEKDELNVKKKIHFLYVLILRPSGYSQDLLTTEKHLSDFHFKKIFAYQINLWETLV